MAGVTDSAFRQICRAHGADVVYTEMVSADGVFHDSRKTLELLKFSEKEQPVVVQLFGKDPDRFTKAAQKCEELGFAGIDINFGCPADEVVGHGGGVTLMRDLDLCRNMIEAAMAGTRLPVSVKVRSSIRRESIEKISQKLSSRKKQKPLSDFKGLTIPEAEMVTGLDFIKHMKALPIAAVMVHGRSYEKPFDGDVDYGMIKAIKRKFGGIVLGNGGIKRPEDAGMMLKKTGCDGVGLARGLYGKSWLFDQIKEYWATGKYTEIHGARLKDIILEHARLAFKEKNKLGILQLRKHLLWYVAGLPGAANMRKQLVAVEDADDVQRVLEELPI